MQCFKIILGKETKAQRPSRAGGCGVILALFKDACPLTEVGWWFITMSIAAKTAMLYIHCVHSALAQISCTLPVTTHWSNHRPYIHKHSQTFENGISNPQPQARWDDLQQFTSWHIKHKSDWLVTYEHYTTEAHVAHSVKHLCLAEEHLTSFFTKFNAVHFFREMCGTYYIGQIRANIRNCHKVSTVSTCHNISTLLVNVC